MSLPPNPYGFTVFSNSAAVNAKIPQILVDMATLGATWLRYQVNWIKIDTVGDGTQDPTTYTWAGLDDVVSRCNAAGITIQFCIQFPPGTPSSALPSGYYTTAVTCSGTTRYLPDATKTGVFAGQLATRYNGVTNVPGYSPLFLDSIEVGNEDYDLFANNTPASCIRDHGGRPLGNSFLAAYPQIKAASPTCLVTIGSLLMQSTTHVSTWLSELFATGAGASLTSITFHWYKGGGTWPVGQSPEAGGVGYTAYYQAIQAACATAGYPNLPIWVTECGYDAAATSGTVNTDYAHQWQYFQQMLDASRTSLGGITHLFWFNIGGANATTSTKSLTYGAPPSETYAQPAFSNLASYIAQYPQWYALTSRDLATRARIALAWDSFTTGGRGGGTTVAAWNPASGGTSWTTSGGSPTFGFSGTQGSVTGTTNTSVQLLGPTGLTDAETLVRFEVSAVADTAGLVLRAAGINNHYRVRYSNGSFALLSVVGGGAAVTLATTSFTASANTLYWIRGRIIGQTLLGRIWADGAVEPASWTLSTRDSALSSGGVGVLTKPNNSSDTISFDSFSVLLSSDGLRDLHTRVRVQSLPQRRDIASRVRLSITPVGDVTARINIIAPNPTLVLALADSIAAGLSDYQATFVSSSGTAGVAFSQILAGVSGSLPTQTMGRLLAGTLDPLDRAALLASGSRVVGGLAALFSQVRQMKDITRIYAPLLDGLDQVAGGLAAWADAYVAQSGLPPFNALFATAFNLFATNSVSWGYRQEQNTPVLLSPLSRFPWAAVDPLYSMACGVGTNMVFTMAYRTAVTYGGGQAPLSLYKTNPGNAVGGATFTITFTQADGTLGVGTYTTTSSQAGAATLFSGALPLGISASAVTGVTGTGMTAGEQYSIGARLVRSPAY